MINWGQLLTTFIFVLGTFASVLGSIYLGNILKQKLPEHTRVALEQFARQAVWQVEQQSGGLSGPAKKQLALSAVLKFFAGFGLPAPPVEIIDIAIEAAVFLINRGIGTAVESDNPPRIESPKAESPRQG